MNPNGGGCDTTIEEKEKPKISNGGNPSLLNSNTNASTCFALFAKCWTILRAIVILLWRRMAPKLRENGPETELRSGLDVRIREINGFERV